MEVGESTDHTAARLVVQCEEFFDLLKEKSTSFSEQAVTVSQSVEKEFESLICALEDKKNALLAKITEINSHRDQDMSELSDRQRKIQTLLQQSQQLGIQGELPEDSHYYRELLTELEQAKQKLQETTDKYQMKFKSSLAPLVASIAGCGEIIHGKVVSSLGGVASGQVDYQQVFASLTQQFEAQCQLAKISAKKEKMLSFNKRKGKVLLLNRKEVTSSQQEMTSSLNNRKRRNYSSLADLLECSAEGDTSPGGAPVLKKIRVDLAWSSDPTSKPYSMWLVSRPAAEDTTTSINSDWLLPSSTDPVTLNMKELFELITGSDSSSWLIAPAEGTQPMDSASSLFHSSLTTESESDNPSEEDDHPSGKGVQKDVDPSKVVNSITAGDMSSWLLGSRDVKDSGGLQCQTSSTKSPLQTDTITDQWLKPRSYSPANSEVSTGDTSHSFEAVDDTDL